MKISAILLGLVAAGGTKGPGEVWSWDEEGNVSTDSNYEK